MRSRRQCCWYSSRLSPCVMFSRRFLRPWFSEDSTSVHLNDVVGLPGLAEERFRWAVEAQIREPTLARNGLDPVLFFSSRGLRAEVDVHRAISVGDRTRVLADARKGF